MRLEGTVQVHTAVVRKCCSRQIVPQGLVNCCEHFRLAHLVYKSYGTSNLCTVCVHILRKLYGVRLEGTVQIRTAGVRKPRLRQIVRHDLVKFRERLRSRTPSVERPTGPPNLVQFVYTAYGSCKASEFRDRKEPYSGCTKMPFNLDCLPRPGEVP